ncbi:MAG: c-type cytochrome [Betaproteobacteria bacterium]
MRLAIPAAAGALATTLLLAAACSRGPSRPPNDAVQEAFREDALSPTEARGHRLFRERCATCHGQEGHGDGQNAYNLDPAPPDFATSLARLPVAARRKVIEGGTAAIGRSPLCPPRSRALDSDEVDALVAWLAVAARPAAEGPAPAARKRR